MILITAILTQLLPWYNNIFFYLFIISIIASIITIIRSSNKYEKKISDFKQTSDCKINELNRIHENKMENIRLEMLKREDDKNRMWSESEKETLKVLSGVSNLLDLSEKINKVESDKIIKKLDDITQLIKKSHDKQSKKINGD